MLFTRLTSQLELAVIRPTKVIKTRDLTLGFFVCYLLIINMAGETSRLA